MATFNLLNGDIAEVTAWQDYNGQTLLNVLHYKLAVPSSIADGAGEVDALVGKLVNDAGATPLSKRMREAQVIALTHVRWTGQLIYPVRRPVQVTAMGQLGLLDQAGLPQNVAGTITKQPDLPGRGRSGSVHVGGMPVLGQDNGFWSAIHLPRLQAIADLVKVNIPTVAAGGQWIPVMWNAATPTVTREVFDTFAQETIRVQRRRTVRLGI